MSIEDKIDEMLEHALLGLKEEKIHQSGYGEFTPIERLMRGAFLAKQIHSSHWLSVEFLNAEPGQFTLEMLKGFAPHTLEGWRLSVIPQVRIGSYRVDFVVMASIKNNETGGEVRRAFLAVECDGHDFHEKTKEQAARDKARDRYITGLHVPMMRFTGSEIWRSPMQCAEEVIGYFEEIIVPAVVAA